MASTVTFDTELTCRGVEIPEKNLSPRKMTRRKRGVIPSAACSPVISQFGVTSAVHGRRVGDCRHGSN